MNLNVSGRSAIHAGLHYVAQDLQSHGMPERTQLLRMSFELGGHDLLLIFSKQVGKAFFDTFRNIWNAPVRY